MNVLNMKKWGYTAVFLILGIVVCAPLYARAGEMKPSEYVVLVRQELTKDREWMKVVHELADKHLAEVVVFEKHPEEVAGELRTIFPRYVALIEKPENITREYVRKMYKLSREMDGDIFQDFLWGVITGYDAESALRMVRDAETPLVIKTAMSIDAGLENYSGFEQSTALEHTLYWKTLWNEDGSEKGRLYSAIWRERRKQEILKTDTVPYSDLASKFVGEYRRLNPDLLVAYSDFESGYIRFHDHAVKGKKGRLSIGLEKQDSVYIKLPGNVRQMLYKKQDSGYVALPEMNARRVGLNIGHNGGVPSDVLLACLKSGNMSALAGSIRSSWHGQSAWGTWKLWMANPGRFSFGEAVYLNQQFILSSLYDWNPKYLEIDYPYTEYVTKDYLKQRAEVAREIGIGDDEVLLNAMGYLSERDIFVYYGDPAWNARLSGTPENVHYKVTSRQKGKKYILTIRTDEHYRRQDMTGNYFREKAETFRPQAIGRLPFVYFFPRRLKNPHLTKELDFEGDVELDENFLFIHNTFWEPGKTYTIVLSADK